MRPFSLKKYLEYFKTGAATTANKKKSNTIFGIMNKTNMHYSAPKVEIISIETQNCFASGPMHSQAQFGISSDSGLGDLDEVSADWN